MNLTVYRIMLLAALPSILFSGCVQDNADNKGDVCTEPYARINGTCCLDVNGNGVCDRTQTAVTNKQSSTTHEESTTSIRSPTTTQGAAISSSSTTTSSSISTNTTQKQCASAGECGEAYYGSCGCRGNNVTRTSYTPICTRGICKYRSDTEVIKCYRHLDGNGDETVSSERCVQGYVSCVSRDDYAEFFQIPDNAVLLQNLTTEGFLEDYRGYRFRTSRVEYPQEMRCFDGLVFHMDVMTPEGTLSEIEYAWNRTAKFDEMEFGLAKVNTVNGSFNPVVWVKRI